MRMYFHRGVKWSASPPVAHAGMMVEHAPAHTAWGGEPRPMNTHTSHSSWLCRHCPRAFALGSSDIKTIRHPGTWSWGRDKVHTMSYLEKSLQVHFSPLKFWAATLLFLPGKTKRLSCILLHSFEKANFMVFTRVKVIWNKSTNGTQDPSWTAQVSVQQ